MVASAIAAPIANAVANGVNGALPTDTSPLMRNFVAGATNSIVRQGVYSAVTGGKMKMDQVLADAFGNFIGESMAGKNVSGASQGTRELDIAQADAGASSYWDSHPMMYAANSVVDDFYMNAHLRNAPLFVENTSIPTMMGQLTGAGAVTSTDYEQDGSISAADFQRSEKESYQQGDFTNPASTDSSDINREIYLLNARTHATSSYSSSGIVNENGKNYYLTMRDENGLGIYQRPDVMMSASGGSTPTFDTIGESRLLGSLSMKYETGKNPTQYGEAAGVVSSGLNDKGGISYGAYQLASSKVAGEQVQKFLKYEGAPWASEFDGLDPKQTGAFGQQWRAIAQDSPDQFFTAQHSYIERTHYTPVVRYLTDKTGLDVSMQPAAVQDAVWSASVQHGGAKYFLTDAVRSADQLTNRSNANYATTLVNAIYDKRMDYVSSLSIPNKQTLLQVRYPDERQRALEMLNSGVR